MNDSSPDRTPPARSERNSGSGIPVIAIAVLVIALLTVLGIGVRYHLHGDVNAIHSLFSLFFSINLLICYWEICLFLRRDYIEKRTRYWRERQQQTGRSPVGEFLLGKVPLRSLLSATTWADVWAVYSQLDESYADRSTYGFNVDTANGFVTLVPTVILYAAYTVGLLPAVLAGIVGVMVFWQWTYATSVYVFSFFVAKRHGRLTRGQVYIYIGALNAPWLLFGLLGLYVSVRLILDGDYGVLG